MNLSDTALKRRAKRFLAGRKLQVFAQVAPPFESAAARELAPWVNDARVVRGGLEFEADLVTLYAVNLASRVVTRFLVRVGTYLAQTYPMLYDHTKRLPWEVFLGNCSCYKLDVAIRSSRLRHADHVAKVVSDAISDRLRALGLAASRSDDASVSFHVRLFRDQATVSLNSSGEPLYKRGYREGVVAAPIRETTAAAVLMEFSFPRSGRHFDPFCGSGTMLIEACGIASGGVALRGRGIGLECTLLHSPGKEREARRMIDQRVRSTELDLQLFGSDTLAPAVTIARENATRAGCTRAQFHEANAFGDDWLPKDSASRTGTVVSNLPYGVRLLDETGAQSIAKEFGRKLAAMRGWQYLLITPHEGAFRESGLQPSRVLTFSNGGITVRGMAGVV